jgi:hypothetical protein
MYFIKPTAGELFYLHTLLTVVKGVTSFEDLRRVPGHPAVLPTYHASSLTQGLLQDDGEWRICLTEAADMQTGTNLRQLFATILLFGEPAEPDALWNEFRIHICDNLQHCIRGLGIQNPTEEQAYDYGLFLLDNILHEHGNMLADWPSMPRPQGNWCLLTTNLLIAEQLNYSPETEQVDFENRLPSLNLEQRAAFDQIVASVERKDGKLFFLNRPGGTGKTFVYNTVCPRLRSQRKIVLCVSSSGISSLLLHGGRMAYSLFKIPVHDLNGQSTCRISKDSDRAKLMQVTDLIIWDEIGAQHCHAVEVVERTL